MPNNFTVPQTEADASRAIAVAMADYRKADMLAASIWTMCTSLKSDEVRSALRPAYEKEFAESIDRAWVHLNLPHPKDAHPQYKKVLQNRAEWQLGHALIAGRIAAISIHHAALDKLVFDLLVVSMALSRQVVIKRLASRKLALGDIHGKSEHEVETIAIEDELSRLERESLTKKWRTFCDYEPPLNETNEQALYQNGELEEFDELRREAVHRFSLTKPPERINTLLQLMIGIAVIIPMRVAKNHKLTIAAEEAEKSEDPFFGDGSWLLPFIP